MADKATTAEFSMTEVATHTTKESAWLVIKDMNDGGQRLETCVLVIRSGVHGAHSSLQPGGRNKCCG